MSQFSLEALRSNLDRHDVRQINPDGLMPAAVMILLYDKDGEYCVLLNKRSQLVEHHKGEMSFPGGAKDPTDMDFLDTALRETEEEMGISRADITVLGQLDDIITRSDFIVKVYVGTIPYPYDFHPSEIEIAEVVETPIKHLLDSQSLRYESRWVDGEASTSVSYAYQDYLVFGATAKILQQLLNIVEEG